MLSCGIRVTPDDHRRPELIPSMPGPGSPKSRGKSNGLLRGRRVAIKDNIAVAGVPMRNGSALLNGYTPDEDATVVTRILDAGGLIAGKTVCERISAFPAAATPARPLPC